MNAILPRRIPTESEIARCLQILGLDADDLRCAYCGDPFTEWDHFRPIVSGRRPTGYFSEIANLVPACGKCNQSKGAKNGSHGCGETPREVRLPVVSGTSSCESIG
ncbi:MAG: HNH endonuclease [Bryobacterales bacterium]|nr:HNH endonuclease [Bryobacterales bacterium]